MARIAGRLNDALVLQGGVIARDHADELVAYLAGLFGSTAQHVRDVVLEQSAAGMVVVGRLVDGSVYVALPTAVVDAA